MITGLNHITLAVKNIESSFSFYRDVLGFTPLCKWEGSVILSNQVLYGFALIEMKTDGKRLAVPIFF
jgi:catechol 2,3-dioxygenase-like lactoylglutathione lyase family enzyme